MFSFPGEVVFDPFLGSGTTILAASQLERHGIGYEINPDFLPIIKQKLGDNTLFAEKINVEYDHSIIPTPSLDTLPYLFKDPHKLNNKVDIKKLNFGSVVDKNGTKGTDFFSLQEIISPNTILLDNGLIVKLIGIKSKHETAPQTVEYLHKKLYRQKMFLKYDVQKYDDKGNLLAYVYLANKTFVNGHLLRTGLVVLDDSYSANNKKFSNYIAK